MQISMWKKGDPGNEFFGARFRKHLELDVDLELDLHLDLHLDLDLDLDLDLNLGQWLSRPVWCKFQCGKDDILVMKFRGLILDEIWSWIWIWRWIWSWIWSWILIWTLIWTCIWIWTAKHRL